jgi:hypothetical protein
MHRERLREVWSVETEEITNPETIMDDDED